MRRDMDLVRELLLRLEAKEIPAGTQWFLDMNDEELAIDGRTQDEVFYHLRLLLDAGFTEPRGNQGMSSFTYSGLTWAGHDFLDSVRDPKVWREAKDVVHKAGGYTVDILVAAAKALVKSNLAKLGLNIDL